MVISWTTNTWKVPAELLTSDLVRKRKQMCRIQFSVLIDGRPSYEPASTTALVCPRSVCKHTCSCFERPWGIHTHRARGHCALIHTLSGLASSPWYRGVSPRQVGSNQAVGEHRIIWMRRIWMCKSSVWRCLSTHTHIKALHYWIMWISVSLAMAHSVWQAISRAMWWQAR